jgi:hypothetical protein
MADPFEFAEAWGGPLRPIEFPAPRPVLPAATVTFLHYAGVPRAFELTTYNEIRFEFRQTAANLAGVWAEEMPDVSLPVGWAGFWRIGDITYTQAAAWLCIEEVTGRVVAVDVEIDNPVYLVNGSVEGMMRCMRAVRDWARPAGGSLARAGSLEVALGRDPGLAGGEAKHFWQPLIGAATESGCDTLVVEFE